MNEASHLQAGKLCRLCWATERHEAHFTTYSTVGDKVYELFPTHKSDISLTSHYIRSFEKNSSIFLVRLNPANMDLIYCDSHFLFLDFYDRMLSDLLHTGWHRQGPVHAVQFDRQSRILLRYREWRYMHFVGVVLAAKPYPRVLLPKNLYRCELGRFMSEILPR